MNKTTFSSRWTAVLLAALLILPPAAVLANDTPGSCEAQLSDAFYTGAQISEQRPSDESAKRPAELEQLQQEVLKLRNGHPGGRSGAEASIETLTRRFGGRPLEPGRREDYLARAQAVAQLNKELANTPARESSELRVDVGQRSGEVLGGAGRTADILKHGIADPGAIESVPVNGPAGLRDAPKPLAPGSYPAGPARTPAVPTPGANALESRTPPPSPVMDIPAAPPQLAPSLFARAASWYSSTMRRIEAWGEKGRQESWLGPLGQKLAIEGHVGLKAFKRDTPEWFQAKKKLERGEHYLQQAQTVGLVPRHARTLASVLPFVGGVDGVVTAQQEPGIFNYAIAAVGFVPGAGTIKAVGKGVGKLTDAAKAAKATDRAKDALRAGAFWTKADIDKFVLPALEQAVARVEELKNIRGRKGLAPLSPAEENRILQVKLYRKLNPIEGTPGRKLGESGITNIDTANDMRIRTRDHHGAFFNPKAPEVNSTMLVLDDIEDLAAANGKIDPKELAKLAQKLERVHTDNMGDGLWGVWVARNLERVAGDPALRDTIRRATGYEDFGVFGQKASALARVDPKLAEATELQNAIFHGYDDILKRFKLADDRFGTLPPEQQRELVDQGLAVIDRALADPAHRAARAREFAASVERSAELSKKAQFSMTPAAQGALARELGSPEAVKGASARYLDRAFVVNSNALDEAGVFAGWAGQAQAHGRELLLGFKKLEDSAGHPRIGLVFSVPNGKSAESLELFGAWLSQANLAKAARLGVPAKDAGAIFGREALQVAFKPGLLLASDEVMAEAVRFAHHMPRVEEGLRRASGVTGAVVGARTIPEGSTAAKTAILDSVREAYKTTTPAR